MASPELTGIIPFGFAISISITFIINLRKERSYALLGISAHPSMSTYVEFMMKSMKVKGRDQKNFANRDARPKPSADC